MSKEAKHTPGPILVRKCPCGHPVCEQYRISTQSTVGFTLADATLYSTAPELLEALEGMLPSNLGPLPDHLSDDGVIPLDVTIAEIRAARAAIAKATAA